MFTGIVETTGRVLSFSRGARAWRLEVAAAVAARGTGLGDSVAVNGCCLTVAKKSGPRLSFDVLEQTRRLTNLSALAPGSAVNLERSLRAGGRMGGHFVSGHIDGLGKILSFERRGSDHRLEIRGPEEGARCLIQKGSIAVDGISLTVAEAKGRDFVVWIIPHTLKVTALRERRAGDGVNLEFDLLGKYVEKLLSCGTIDANRPRRPERRTAPAQSRGRRLRRSLG